VDNAAFVRVVFIICIKKFLHQVLHNISAHDYAQATYLNCSAAMMVAMVTVLKMTIMMEIDLMITNWSLYTPLSE
jgi:hypothetical protein